MTVILLVVTTCKNVQNHPAHGPHSLQPLGILLRVDGLQYCVQVLIQVFLFEISKCCFGVSAADALVYTDCCRLLNVFLKQATIKLLQALPIFFAVLLALQSCHFTGSIHIKLMQKNICCWMRIWLPKYKLFFSSSLNIPGSFICSSGGLELCSCILSFFTLFNFVFLTTLLPAELLNCIY